jgi:hypothetical protein
LGAEYGGRIGYAGGGSVITLMDGTKVQIPDGAYQGGSFKDIIYSSDKGDLLREEIIRGLSFAQGGRIGYAGGSDDEARAMEQAAEDLKRTMHSFTEKRGPLYIDPNYDLDIPLTSFEKALREMTNAKGEKWEKFKEEREEELKRLERTLEKRRGNIGRDLGIPVIDDEGNTIKTGKERRMELLNWGTDRPSKDTGYFDDYSMRHRAAEYLDRPYFDEHYETGEHFNRGGRTGIETLRGRR